MIEASSNKKQAAINLAAIKGERGTGFEKAGTLGEFECGNCSFFEDKDDEGGACYQEDMMAKSKELKHEDGSVKVEAEDCCEYVDRVGREDEDV